MINESFFYDQKERSVEAERWFKIICENLEGHVTKFNGYIKSYVEQFPFLQENYWTGCDKSESGAVVLANGSAKVRIVVNEPPGWITVEGIRKGPFSVVEVSLGAVGVSMQDFENAKMTGLGSMSGCVHVRDVTTKVNALLFDTELTTFDFLGAEKRMAEMHGSPSPR